MENNPRKSGSFRKSDSFYNRLEKSDDGGPPPEKTGDSDYAHANDSSHNNAKDSDHPIESSQSGDQRDHADGDESLSSDHRLSFEDAAQDIDRLITSLSIQDRSNHPSEIPNTVEKFVRLVQSKIDDYESGSAIFGRDAKEDSALIDAVSQISKLTKLLAEFSPDSSTSKLLSRTSMVVQQAMNFMEEELRMLLEDSTNSLNASEPKSPKSKHSSSNQESDQNKSADSEGKMKEEGEFPAFSDEVISNIKRIASSMLSTGYVTECCQVYSITRRNAFKEAMKQQGFERIGIDDIQKMQWETLEGHITTWVKVVRYSAKVLFPGEKKLCYSVFSNYPSMGEGISTNLARAVIILFLNFAEAVALTKRSAERLFKVLDIYETLAELISTFNEPLYSKDCADELRSEISAVQHRLGEAAVCIFCDLENSIKSDVARNPVPSGAVHPLTRYTMNYLRYACDFKDALEQVFAQRERAEQLKEGLEPLQKEKGNQDDNSNNNNNQKHKFSPFAAQLIAIMDLLDANLEAKSKLYKDPSLRYIFLMNNGRYILQKIKESTETHQLVGDNWRRKRSSELRSYHKNYQRETWSKALQCLSHDGLQVNGKVHKPILKDRFKNFNQMFDDIHKTQSTWVVSDEQLQSELRVSISAVMIPAYRSFLARFGQYFTPGRQMEKYVKYQPEDIETVIEGLFDGNPTSMARRRN
ncbi:hypothetical protein Ancab_018211 [Ancistrocladus abbreviatus]